MKYLLNFILILMIFSGLGIGSDSQVNVDSGKLTRVVEYSGEDQLFFTFNLSTGYIDLSKTSTSKLFEGEFYFNKTAPKVDYEKVGSEGRLVIDFDEDFRKEKDTNQSTRVSSLKELYENECIIRLNPDVPLNLDMEMGVVKGNMDFSNLKIKTLKLEAGVSQASLEFNKPNPITLESLDIEAGVGKFKMTGLGNANFTNFDFDGGLGSYELYFDGKLRKDATVNINMGLGKLTLYLPRSYGVRLKINKSFLSSVSVDDVYKKDNFYFNESWGKTKSSFDIEVDTGLGKIDVVWLDD